ncbi:unnamed protein product [Cladocopium goreaui]|uniref:SET domain-containing protein L678 n=1 Tax=Cladocopium goreaui TaxID=2562237 RepID=A0A9P1C788_9DINO|nr:unnamed protein product [Cladocopium goreaui]
MSICDGSVPNSELFEEWAAKKVDLPKLSECFELRRTESLGIHAVARCAIHPGDLIISEDALLRLSPLTADARSLLQRFGELGEFLTPALAVDWTSTTPQLREASLKLFYAHPGTEKRSQDSHLAACEELLRWPPLRSTKWTPQELLHFLHIVDLNIHKDDERPQNAEFTGIFLLGSKFSHSCAPNASWAFDAAGHLQYRAIRPIAPLEVLTFSYVGNGMNLITSTLIRRQRLAQLCFVCGCQRCAAEDLPRRVQCPGGCGGYCFPCYTSQDDQGFANAGPRHSMIQDAASWRCSTCKVDISPSDLPLHAEEELAELVPRFMQSPASKAPEDAARLRDLRLKAATLLGKGHWTYFLATFAWLQKCLALMRNETVIPFSERDLSSACVEVAEWLEVAAADNVEQRLCALFLAVRLAQHLGLGLKSWGYDALNPLKEMPCSDRRFMAITKLELMGWELQDDCIKGPPEFQPADLQRLKDGLVKSGGPIFSAPGWR